MKKITQAELELIKEKHKLWAYFEKGGERADLSYCDCSDLDFSGAILIGAILNYAILTRVNMINANLTCAIMTGSNMTGANMTGADLMCANFTNANLNDAILNDVTLWDTVGNGEEIKSTNLGIYNIAYTAEVLQIGCEQYPIEDWWEFSDDDIFNMDGQQAVKFWHQYKNFIKQMIELSPAKPTKEQ